MKSLSKTFVPVFLLSIFVSANIVACPVCYGNAQSPVLDGVNNAVVAMLGFTGLVFSGFISFFFAVRKRMHNKKNNFFSN
jgi:hypothetical protein